jgi:hypothetical protein
VRARLAALLGFGVLVLVGLGCTVPDAESEAQTDPSTKVEPGPERFEPLVAEPGTLVSADGRMRVPVPEGQGWECVEERLGEGQAVVTALRCRRTDPAEFVFLAAKLSRQPADQRTDARTLLMSLYRADNEAFFETVEYLRDGPAQLSGAAGWEAELAATHARAGGIRKWERVAIVGDRIYAVSAEGRAEAWEGYAEVISTWFAGVEIAR